LSAAFLLPHSTDGRVFFVIPWLGKTLIGTTDTLDAGGPDAVSVTPEDVAYLLEGHNAYFSHPLSESDIVGSFAGLRPLLLSKADDPASMTRDFRVFTSPSGLISIAGGKYTTYRHMAEVVTDDIARRLGNRRPCRTRDKRLDGAAARLVAGIRDGSHRVAAKRLFSRRANGSPSRSSLRPESLRRGRVYGWQSEAGPANRSKRAGH
jgi:glycerol-3-phosphate dehydrogenase